VSGRTESTINFELIAPALELAAIDWPLIESEHLRVVGHPLVARRVTGHATNPLRDDLLTQRIARRSNRLREEHMLQRLLDALAEYRRLFAVVGNGHLAVSLSFQIARLRFGFCVPAASPCLAFRPGHHR
jgi:hypothetical protein